MTSGNKSVIVLGMHRSRTSLVAKILMELGVFMGNAFRKPDQANPYGYWEDLAWRNINKTLLNASGHTWWNPPSLDSKREELFTGGLYCDVLAMAEVITKRRSYHRDLWGFKDPRTILTLKYFGDMFPDPHYVVVRRDITDIAMSLAKRADTRGYKKLPSEWLDLINIYYAHLVTFIGGVSPARVHTIDSDDLVYPGGPTRGTVRLRKNTVHGLADFVGVDPPDNIQAFMKGVSGNKLI